MGYVIVVANGKGGVGKSTLAGSLTIALHDMRLRVAGVDSDCPQYSLAGWLGAIDDGPAITRIENHEAEVLRIRELKKHINRLRTTHDFIVVDTKGEATTMTDAAIYLADLVLIPFQPSAFDVWQLEVTLDGVAAAQEDNDGKPEARLVLNQTSDRDSLAETVRDLVNKHDIPYCHTNIPRLNVFRDAPDQGTSITRSTYKRDQPHKERFLTLLHELVGPLIEKQPRRKRRAANE